MALTSACWQRQPRSQLVRPLGADHVLRGGTRQLLKKIGNAHLRWAFAEAACLFLRSSARAKKWKQKQAAQRGEGKALAILAARLGRAVYHMLRKREAFDEARFWDGGHKQIPTGSSSLYRSQEATHAAD